MKEIFLARVYVDGVWYYMNQDQSAWDAQSIDEAYEYPTYPLAAAALEGYVPEGVGVYGAVDKLFKGAE